MSLEEREQRRTSVVSSMISVAAQEKARVEDNISDDEALIQRGFKIKKKIARAIKLQAAEESIKDSEVVNRILEEYYSKK